MNNEVPMTRIHITGMSCGHCEASVEKALTNVPGVDRVVRVDRQREEAVVEGPAAAQALEEAIIRLGFQAKVTE